IGVAAAGSSELPRQSVSAKPEREGEPMLPSRFASVLHQGRNRDVRPAQSEEVQQNRLRVLKLQEVAASMVMLDLLNPERCENRCRVRVGREKRDVLDATAAVRDWGHRRTRRSDRKARHRRNIEHHRLDDGLTRPGILEKRVWVGDNGLGDRNRQRTRSKWIRSTEIVFGEAVWCSWRRNVGAYRERHGVGC